MLCHVPTHQPDIDESTITPTISPSYIFRSWAPSMADKKLENHGKSPYKNLETLGESPPLGFQAIWVDPKSQLLATLIFTLNYLQLMPIDDLNGGH